MTMDRRTFAGAAMGMAAVGAPTNADQGGVKPALQRVKAASPWRMPNEASPLADLHALWKAHKPGGGCFDATAVAVMNRHVFDMMRMNANSADLYGRRTRGLGLFNNLRDINSLLEGDDMPTVAVYDGMVVGGGRHLPDNLVVVVPTRLVEAVAAKDAGDVAGAVSRFLHAEREPFSFQGAKYLMDHAVVIDVG